MKGKHKVVSNFSHYATQRLFSSTVLQTTPHIPTATNKALGNIVKTGDMLAISIFCCTHNVFYLLLLETIPMSRVTCGLQAHCMQILLNWNLLEGGNIL